MVVVSSRNLVCLRCGHSWVCRGSLPKEVSHCPKCISPYWNIPRGFLSRGRPRVYSDPSVSEYVSSFKFDLDYSSIFQYRCLTGSRVLYLGSFHNSLHTKYRLRFSRFLSSGNLSSLSHLDPDFYPHYLRHVGCRFSFIIPSKYFDLRDPSEVRLLYSPFNLLFHNNPYK